MCHAHDLVRPHRIQLASVRPPRRKRNDPADQRIVCNCRRSPTTHGMADDDDMNAGILAVKSNQGPPRVTDRAPLDAVPPSKPILKLAYDDPPRTACAAQ